MKRGVRSGVFTIEEGEIFIPQYPVMAIFHYLSKTHKGLNPLVGKPIVSGIGSLNERLGQWLDTPLQPLVRELPTELPIMSNQAFVRHYGHFSMEGWIDLGHM